MSRIGKKPVEVPKDVNVTLSGRTITMQGKEGTLTYEHRPEVEVKWDEGERLISVTADAESRPARAFWGLTRALVQNMVIGVKDGYKKELEINGVGWTAKVQGMELHLNIGYADTRKVAIPMGVKVESKGPRITVTGPDKQLVGQFAAMVRSQRKPEPYNLKGIKYVDEVIVKKEGKQFAGK